MLKITFAPDGTTDWATGIVLCNTSRSITEMNFEFNHQRVISIEHLAQALGSPQAALAQDFVNWRNIISLTVRRSVDFTAAAFADPEAALVFALQQPASFATTGALKMQITGVTTNTSLYLLNTAVQAIQLPSDGWLGIAPAFRYTFNGGLISPTSPF